MLDCSKKFHNRLNLGVGTGEGSAYPLSTWAARGGGRLVNPAGNSEGKRRLSHLVYSLYFAPKLMTLASRSCGFDVGELLLHVIDSPECHADADR